VLAKLPLHRINPRRSVECTLTNTYHRSNPLADDHNQAALVHSNSRSVNIEDLPDEDVRSYVDGVRSASDVVLEGSLCTSSSLAKRDIGADRETREDFHGKTTNDNIEASIEFTDLWMDDITIGSRNSTSWLDLSGPWTLPSPLSTTVPVRSQVRTVQCQIWETSNKIYSQISKISPDCAAAVDFSSANYAGSIFKAVINGWAALSIQERSNPILQILRDIDQVFPQLDRATRVAFMYKSHMLLMASLKRIAALICKK
jgi:hypothetical protein